MEDAAGHDAYSTATTNNSINDGVDNYDDGYESGTDSDYDHESDSDCDYDSDSDQYDSEDECYSVSRNYGQQIPFLRRSPRLARQGRVDYRGY